MKFLDLFAGIGGFRLGMEAAGHKCVGFCEIDKFARKSYKAIHDTKDEVEWHDITDISDEHFRLLRGKVDIICGGFPCQAFSVAGKRRGFEDTRGTLFFHIARAAKEIKPRFLFLENVKGLLSHDKGKTFATILSTLDELGYNAEWQVLNSKDFGVPQNRERVYIIGHSRRYSRREVFPIRAANGEVIVPVEIIAHRKGYRRNTQVFAPNVITEALDTGQGGGRGHYTIIDDQGRTTKELKQLDIVPTLRAQSHGNEPKVVIPVLTPDRAEKRQNGRRFKEDGEPMFTLTAQDRHGIMLNRHEIKGKTDISHCLMARDYKGIGNQDMAGVLEIREATKKGFAEAEPGDSVNYSLPNSETRRGRVGKGIANTLDTGCQQGVVTEDIRIRKLTPRECWRLQGFPDWAFDKAREVNSDSQLYKQAGNSVTVPVIYEIAKKFE